MEIKSICLDLDGVLCDFILPAIRLFTDNLQDVMQRWPVGINHNEKGSYIIYDLLGVKSHKFWEVIKEKGKGHQFWAELPRYMWCMDLMNACREIAPTIILTSPSRAVSSVKGKVCWMQRQFGMKFDGYLIGSGKHHCARPGSILIDDQDKNCEAWREHGGTAIVFPQHWNSAHADAGRAFPVVIEQLQALASVSAAA